MKRREFLIVSAQLLGSAAVACVYPKALAEGTLFDVDDPIWTKGLDPDGDHHFLIDMRLLDHGRPVSGWFTVPNNTATLFFKRSPECVLTHLEYRIPDLQSLCPSLPIEAWTMTVDFPIPVALKDSENLKLDWTAKRIIEITGP